MMHNLFTSSFSSFTTWLSASSKAHLPHERSPGPGIPQSSSPEHGYHSHGALSGKKSPKHQWHLYQSVPKNVPSACWNHYRTVFKQPHRASSGFPVSFCAPAVPWYLLSLWCAQKLGRIAIVSSSLLLCILFCLCFSDSWIWQQKENICQEHALEEEDFNTEEKLERW